MNIYLDYAAATPCDKWAFLKSLKYNFFTFGNPLSVHDYGVKAKQAINLSREIVAGIIGASSSEIFFCGSGTESINLGLLGVASANWGRGKHIITSVTEHHAVLNTMESLESRGFEVTYLPVDEMGLLNPEIVKKYLRADTILVSVMLANNETGVIQPIKEITKIVKEYNADCMVHTDACQAGNWMNLDVNNLGVDLLSLDSSKIYGPKGVGALFVKTGAAIYPIIHGGTQENNLRAGTHNVVGIVGFAQAFKISKQRQITDTKKTLQLKSWLVNELNKIDNIKINSQLKNSLPHIVNFSIVGKAAGDAVAWFNKQGVAVSAGAACTTGTLKPSHVVLAQTGSIDLAYSAIRVSLGRKTKLHELKKLVSLLQEYIKLTN